MQEQNKNTIEIDALDLKYASFRLPDKKRSDILLSSVSESGILTAVVGVREENRLVLLDGFKRVQCAKKLNIRTILFEVLADDCVSGIIKFLKISNSKSLQFFEQAKLVEELKKVHQMTIPEIAKSLEKSAAWVSVRLTFLKEMSPKIQEQVFKGQIAPQFVLYTLQQIRRLNKVSNKELECFTTAIAGQGLSVRDSERLAKAYFTGGELLKKQIESGDFAFTLGKIKEIEKDSPALMALTEKEKSALRDLEITNKYIQRLNNFLPHLAYGKVFMSQALILVEGILSHLGKINQVLNNFLKEDYHDQSRAQTSDPCSARTRDGDTSDCEVDKVR